MSLSFELSRVNSIFFIQQLADSALCNGQGTFECGQCSCDKGRYGKKCECDGSQSTSDESLAKCIK